MDSWTVLPGGTTTGVTGWPAGCHELWVTQAGDERTRRLCGRVAGGAEVGGWDWWREGVVWTPPLGACGHCTWRQPPRIAVLPQ
jgi:hypothetical protein